MKSAKPTEDTQKKDDEINKPSRLQSFLLKGRWRPLMYVLYAIGLLWHGMHPFVSVFTGEAKPRRLYVDENSAEPHYFRVNHQKFKRREQLVPKKSPPLSSLCQSLMAVTSAEPQDLSLVQRPNFACRNMGDNLQVAQLTPASGPLTIQSEAVVFVLPATADWIDSPLHAAFLSFVVDLLQPSFDWLAKTVFIVAPRDTLNVSQAVDLFLDVYLGPAPTSHATTSALPLPAGLTAGALLRQLIVWDQVMNTTTTTTAAMPLRPLPVIRMLPQGRQGVLPNMDLVSVVRAALLRSAGSNVDVPIHPYDMERQVWYSRLDSVCHWIWGTACPASEALLNMFWFQQSLRSSQHRPAPHASALDRGIDALTVQLVLPTATIQAPTRATAAKLSAAMEITLRSLSNLHERLHHSTSLYLMLDADHFVKHEEYLVPNLLLLIPLILRAVTLILAELKGVDWKTVGRVVESTILAVIFTVYGLALVQFANDHSWWIVADRVGAGHVVVGFASLVLVGQSLMAGTATRWTRQGRQSVQLLTCLWGLYTHVALAFGHVSLAFPSAVLWTPLLAFPSYQDESPEGSVWRLLWRCVGAATLVLTLPGTGLVPHMVSSYTPYVCYAYLPLYFMASPLWLS
jgi:glycosylphosphatidylinositol transamidase